MGARVLLWNSRWLPQTELQNDEECTALAPVELARSAEAAALEQIPLASAPRVLVVEDEPTVASLIADVLREEGMRVDVLLDGRQALQQAEPESYDLAICDMKMPGMDGQRFYQALVQRQNPLHEHVLFVTGDMVASRTQEFLERHHLAHVAKPFRMEELSGAVQECWERKRRRLPSRLPSGQKKPREMDHAMRNNKQAEAGRVRDGVRRAGIQRRSEGRMGAAP